MNKEAKSAVLPPPVDQDAHYWHFLLNKGGKISKFPHEGSFHPSRANAASETLAYPVPDKVFERLKELCRQSDYGLYMFVLAAVQYAMFRYTRDEYITIGMPRFLENRQEENRTPILLVQTQAMLTSAPKDLISLTKAAIQEAVKHDRISLRSLGDMAGIEYDASGKSVIDTVVSLDAIHGTRHRDFVSSISEFAFHTTGGHLEIHASFMPEAYAQETIARIVAHIVRTITYFTEQPAASLSEFEIVTEEEKAFLMAAGTPNPGSRHTLVEQFEHIAEQYAEHTALRFQTNQWTYRELVQQSDRMASHLAEQGVRPGQIVGILLSRSESLLFAILGVLRLGAAYLPIDPALPRERIAYMLEDSKASSVITQTRHLSVLEGIGAISVNIDGLDEAVPNFTRRTSLSEADLAYLIYTSGSTGNPKGVMISHGALSSFIAGISAKLALTAGRSIAALTTVSFDISILELLVPLAKGMNVVLADEEQQRDARKLNRFLSDNDVDIVQMTPSRLHLLLNGGAAEGLQSVKELLVGGEAVTKELVERMKPYPHIQLYNMYGPTEATIWITAKPIKHAGDLMLGDFYDEVIVQVRDSDLQLAPVGVVGELCIGGPTLAQGYLGKEELTGSKFVADPLREGEIIYRTGDLAKKNVNGEIEFLGRADYQVKVNGYRIELGEIEARMLEHPNLTNACVIHKQTKASSSLICFAVTDGHVDKSEMALFLSERLPSYMIPSDFVVLSHIPLTPNGKVDRHALDKIPLAEDGVSVPPQTDIQKKLVAIWKQVLDVNEVGINHNFFQLGGHSVNMIQLEVEMENQHLSIPIRLVYERRTIQEIAEWMEDHPEGAAEIADADYDWVDHRDQASEGTLLFHEEQETIAANILPYNDYFYKSCFYNSLFPVINHHLQSVLPFLVNETQALFQKKSDTVLWRPVQYHSAIEEVEMLRQLGISAQSDGKVDFVCDKIMDDLRNKRLPIIWIDTFYSSIRQDTYQKLHWPHSILIFGANEKKRLFYVIEHTYRESLSYRQRAMPFEDVEQAYRSYAACYADGNDDYFSYSLDFTPAAPTIAQMRHTYLTNVRNHAETIERGIVHIDLCAEAVGLYLPESAQHSEESQYLLETFNEIYNVKLIQSFIAQSLLSPLEYEQLSMPVLLEKWMAIRNLTAKSFFSKRISEKKLKHCIQLLQEIKDEESRIHDMIGKLQLN
ncbi:amino acid adenylation domain-containing protein [Paenibacillus cellulosilyticus]|uniref:Amino acid adenylation domain-containing protein n=1 Tax=Paenibacillus cellulosilyticus TaxID=375489 RepID=A0A2V2Z1A5_9BACL|nr:amino acid adenylation domain-containing protein [Paenibacillus cellulosilyticus]PWW07321.1 amino acid adenylation domain-containing protein [Paenibacillus cellulosilyticus]QKS44497.1 amino acid adenylation domain-containing protein [Paenibacillus cellulosilyticus]